MRDFSLGTLARNYVDLVRESFEQGSWEKMKNGLSIIFARFIPEGGQALRIVVVTGVVYGSMALFDILNARFSSDGMDRDKMLESVRENGGDALVLLPKKYRGDREVVLTALEDDGSALELASDALRSDRMVVSYAVTRSGGAALEFASDSLRDDLEIVLLAVATDGLSLVHASEALQRNRAVVLAACENDGRILEELDPAFQDDREVVLTAVKSKATAIRSASGAMRSDRAFMKEALQANPGVKQYITKSFAAELVAVGS
jgi:hypothetical protein